jgi:hypothetical protein
MSLLALEIVAGAFWQLSGIGTAGGRDGDQQACWNLAQNSSEALTNVVSTDVSRRRRPLAVLLAICLIGFVMTTLPTPPSMRRLDGRALMGLNLIPTVTCFDKSIGHFDLDQSPIVQAF